METRERVCGSAEDVTVAVEGEREGGKEARGKKYYPRNEKHLESM